MKKLKGHPKKITQEDSLSLTEMDLKAMSAPFLQAKEKLTCSFV